MRSPQPQTDQDVKGLEGVYAELAPLDIIGELVSVESQSRSVTSGSLQAGIHKEGLLGHCRSDDGATVEVGEKVCQPKRS